MLTLRVTAAERVLLRRLALGHHSDVSEVVTDGLLDVLPVLLCPVGIPARYGLPAPCALTVWLPGCLADLLPDAAVRVSELHGVRLGSASAVLGLAVRFWLGQEPEQLVAGLGRMHGRRAAAPVAA